MGMTKKQVIEYNDECKEALYIRIREIITELTEYQTKIKESGKLLKFNANIPNVGITFHNKLNEISQDFDEAGMLMFVEIDEKNGFVYSNFVGDAIIEDMLTQLENAEKAFNAYDSKVAEITIRKKQKVEDIRKLSPIKRFFLEFRALFNPELVSIDCTQQEAEEINTCLSAYRDADDKFFAYNLRDNVISSIKDYVKKNGYTQNVVESLMEDDVEEKLKKLGLGDLIPELRRELIEQTKTEKTKKQNSWELNQEQKTEIQENSIQAAKNCNNRQISTQVRENIAPDQKDER